jgi:hypothetical protein
MPERKSPTAWIAAGFALLSVAATLPAACRFDPDVPDGTIACQNDGQCPADLSCRLLGRAGEPGLCCRTASCGGAAPQPPPSAGGPATAPPDAAPPPPDAAADLSSPGADAATDAAPGGGEGTENLVSCAPDFTTLTAATNERLHCTISLQGDYAYLKVDRIRNNDPVTTQVGSSCWTALPLELETFDPAANAARPLTRPTLDRLAQAVAKMQQQCTQVRGNLVGAVADAWLRRATNQQEVVTRVRTASGLTVDVPSEAQALTHIYLGLSRNRRGRLVFNDWPEPQLLAWPVGANAPIRYPVPITFAETGEMYLANTVYNTFDNARYALRTFLADEMASAVEAIDEAVRDDDMASTVAVGRTDATIPLAVKGRLHDGTRVWFDPEAYKRALEGAMLSLTSYGWDFGVVRPAEIDAFFPAITPREFTQLRSSPLRMTYGQYLLLDTVLLDILADEALITEFGFPQTFFHYGYLFQKLFPTPAAM